MSNAYFAGEKETRPWGYFEVIHVGDQHTCKVLVVHPHRCLSLQSHKHRAEHWVIVQGTATVQLGWQARKLGANEHLFIDKQQIHCLANHTDTDLVLIEVQTGDVLDETDITRYDHSQNLIHKETTK